MLLIVIASFLFASNTSAQWSPPKDNTFGGKSFIHLTKEITVMYAQNGDVIVINPSDRTIETYFFRKSGRKYFPYFQRITTTHVVEIQKILVVVQGNIIHIFPLGGIRKEIGTTETLLSFTVPPTLHAHLQTLLNAHSTEATRLNILERFKGTVPAGRPF